MDAVYLTIGIVRTEKGEPMREKLIELLSDMWMADSYEEIADYLLGNGVTVPVGEIDFDYNAEDV